MTRVLNKIHNRSCRNAVKQIVKPTLDAGGGAAEVSAVLESTITAVLLNLAQGKSYPAIMLLEEKIIPAVRKKLLEYTPERTPS